MSCVHILETTQMLPIVKLFAWLFAPKKCLKKHMCDTKENKLVMGVQFKYVQWIL